jgi:DNA polymerase I
VAVLKYVAVDIETTGLSFKKDKILGVGIGDTYHTEYFGGSGEIGKLCFPATAHNGKFELKHLRAAGIPFDWQMDTLLAASILINRPKDLDLASVAQYYLGMESWKSDTDKLFKKKNWVQLLEADPKLQQALAERNVYDLKATAQLTEVLLHQLEKEGMTSFFFEKLMPAARLLADTEYRGMRIDVEATKNKLRQIEYELRQYCDKLTAWLGAINLNSPLQLKKALHQKGYDLSIWDFKKRYVVDSTGAEALEKLLPNENIQMLLDYKSALKMQGFLQGWLDENIDGYLYPSYNIANTRTGRLSCSSPNLQQVPRDKTIRSLFIPSPGKVFVIGDYSQIEVRVAAHYTQDETLTKVFTDGLDFYGSIANNVLGVKCHPNEVKKLFPKERAVAKEIGLSILYGIGAAKLSSIIKKRTGTIFSKEECAQIIRDYFKSYPRLLQFRNYVINKIESGDIIKTKYGRQFKIDPEKGFSTGTNTIIQSTASDACLFSQLEIEKALEQLNIKAPLIGLIHDECIRECDPKDAEVVGTLMEKIMCDQGFDCPIKFEWGIGNSWGSKK